jgi:hypothetical protein
MVSILPLISSAFLMIAVWKGAEREDEDNNNFRKFHGRKKI